MRTRIARTRCATRADEARRAYSCRHSKRADARLFRRFQTASRPQSDFGAYAKSFGIKLKKTSQTYRVGETQLNVWGSGGAAFQWTP
jgi:hypothetical protein